MNRYLIDTRADEATLAYSDGSASEEWEITGEPTEPETLTLTNHGVPLVQLIIEADGSILIDVHEELTLELIGVELEPNANGELVARIAPTPHRYDDDTDWDADRQLVLLRGVELAAGTECQIWCGHPDHPVRTADAVAAEPAGTWVRPRPRS